jgi:hypothetical protein
MRSHQRWRRAREVAAAHRPSRRAARPRARPRDRSPPPTAGAPPRASRARRSGSRCTASARSARRRASPSADRAARIARRGVAAGPDRVSASRPSPVARGAGRRIAPPKCEGIMGRRTCGACRPVLLRSGNSAAHRRSCRSTSILAGFARRASAARQRPPASGARRARHGARHPV